MMKYLVSAPTWCDHLIKKQYRLEQYCSASSPRIRNIYCVTVSFVPVNSCPQGRHVGNKYKHLPSPSFSLPETERTLGWEQEFFNFFKEKSKGKYKTKLKLPVLL